MTGNFYKIFYITRHQLILDTNLFNIYGKLIIIAIYISLFHLID